MANQGVHVGLDPDPITVHYVKGYPLSFSMVFRVAKVATNWPEAPILVFGDPDSSETFSKTAILTQVDAAPTSKATWSFTSLEIEEIDELPDESAAVVVDEMPYWVGQVIRHG